MEMNNQSHQDAFLQLLREKRVPVSIYLVNGIQLTGIIEAFDPYVVLLQSAVTQAVYKHAISTIVPSRAISLDPNNPTDDAAITKRTQFGLRRQGNTVSTGRSSAGMYDRD